MWRKNQGRVVGEGALSMSKPDRLAYIVIGSGLGLGFVVGGTAGIICGVTGVLIGSGWLAWIITSSAKHEGPGEVGSAESYSAHGETKILLVVRDVQARQFPESEANDFDVFLNLWLVSETEFDLAIKECQLKIKAHDGSAMTCERIGGDLDKWHLGKEKEQWDMWDTSDIRAVRESIPELNTTEPLQVGVRREGWLHFRIQNISPEQFKTGSMELSVEDSLSHKHVAAVSCTRHLPGKVWPLRSRNAQCATS
jgi:hypothetical protein